MLALRSIVAAIRAAGATALCCPPTVTVPPRALSTRSFPEKSLFLKRMLQAWLRDTDFPCGSLARKSAAEGTSANASPPRPTGLPRRLTAVGDDGILSSDRFPDSPDAPAGAADPDRVPGPPGQRASFSTTRRTAKRPRHARTRSDVPAAASDASDSSPPHLSGLLRRAQTLAGKLKCAQGLRRHGRQLAVLVVSLGGVLAAASGALVLAAVLALQGACVRTLFLFLGAACAVVSANCTHGLGGWLRWRAPGLLTPGSWRFFQPFRGGRFFMATQGAGWTLFSAGLFGMMVAGRMAAVGAVRWLHHVSLATAAAVIAAQVLLGELRQCAC